MNQAANFGEPPFHLVAFQRRICRRELGQRMFITAPAFGPKPHT
jgi:hypothetical protein